MTLSAAVVVSLVVVVWFVALRGNGAATSEFIAAHDRFVAAERKVEAATGDVQRFLELDEFKAVVDTQLVVMEHQHAVLERIAAGEDGETKDLADQSVAQAARVITAANTHADAIIRTRRLSDAAAAIAEMQAGVAELDRLAAEWKKLQ